MKAYTIYIDEVGRWPLAWPMYVGLVMLQGRVSLQWYKDSKKCSPALREQLYHKMLQEKHLSRVTAKCTAAYIDKSGISKSLQTAICTWLEKLFNQSLTLPTTRLHNIIKQLSPKNITLVIDGNYDFGLQKKLGVNVQTIIHGDDLVPQISMASILAKVERDTEMVRYHQKYPKYGFDKHKWYGTLQHRKALKKYGPCKIHRLSFLAKILAAKIEK